MAVTSRGHTTVHRTAGAAWTFDVDVRDDVTGDQVRGDIGLPAVTVTTPNGATVDVDPVEVNDVRDHYFRASMIVTTAGRYVASVTVADYGTALFACWVDPVVAATGMPDIEDVDVYLGDHSWSDEQLQDALDAEADDQRHRCAVPAAYPAALRQALLRRCAVNLAKRRVLLDTSGGDSDSDYGPQVLPYRDPEVRRFEGPFRRLVVG